MKKELKRQLEIDLNGTLDDSSNHVFVSGGYNKEMRYWSRCDATLIIHNGRLLFRSDNESLTQAVRERYESSNAQWFGTVSNLKAFEILLIEFGYSITNYAPFYMPSSKFDATEDNEIKFYYGDEIHQFKDNKQFSECFCFEINDPDLIGAALIQDGQIVAMAGINQNGLHALEIGVNVLESYQGKGYATRVVQAVTQKAKELYPETLIAYGTQFTHMQSINVAARSGFEYALSQIMISKIR